MKPYSLKLERSTLRSNVSIFIICDVCFVIFGYLAMLMGMWVVSRMTREPYKPWIPDSKDTGALEKAISMPCQGA